MTASNLANLPIGITTEITTTSSPNFKLGSWPPRPDFPIVVDAKGNVISRFSDDVWQLWPWSNKLLSLNFVDSQEPSGNLRVSDANSHIFRLTACWLIYGPESVQTAQSLVRRFQTIKIIMKAATRAGILVTDFFKYPRLVEKLGREMSPHEGSSFIYLMHQLLNNKSSLGFVLLDSSSLKTVSSLLRQPQSSQTAYIPPRIWKYQSSRLAEFIDDFHQHKQALTDCYNFCLKAYIDAFGSLELACAPKTEEQRMLSPFAGRHRKVKGHNYLGKFSYHAERFGISDLLKKWIVGFDRDFSGGGRGVTVLSAYFSMTNHVALATILSHSMMRVEEAWTLKADCFREENDENFGKIYYIRGITTKTTEDDDARWITSPLVQPAIEAACLVSSLRSICENANPTLINNNISPGPMNLFARAQEPWANRQVQVRGVIAGYNSYSSTLKMYPHLFSDSELTILPEDLRIARLLTPTLDGSKFSEGMQWPFAWHQLRRTGAVNMQSSGLVSDSSMQYQLKHTTRAMSLYYGRGYSSLRLNESTRNEYVKTMYEILAREIEKLVDDRYISPYGSERKSEILRLVSATDLTKLIAAGKKGEISWRQTLFGGCTKRGFCEYGGLDNVSRCGGGDGKSPCADALFDLAKKPIIMDYSRIIDQRILATEIDSPSRSSLRAQKQAVNNVLEIIDKMECC